MSDILSSVDVDGVCRLCLKGDGTIIPIFGRENTSRDCIPLSKKIFDCISVKVSKEDGMPSMICVGCVHQVDSWHGFKMVCDKSQHKLLSWLERTKPDIFAKNQAKEQQAQRVEMIPQAQNSAVINLSSDDDDDVVVTIDPPRRGSIIRNIPRVRNRPTRETCTINLLTNEIEVLPVADANTRLQDNFGCVEIFPSTTERREPSASLESSSQNKFEHASLNSTDDLILPDVTMTNDFTNLDPHEHPKESTKETLLEPAHIDEPIVNNEETTENLVSLDIEHVQINETEFDLLPENESHEQENSTENPLEPKDISKSDIATLEENQEVMDQSETDKIDNSVPNLNSQNDTSIDQNSSVKNSEKYSKKFPEIPTSNSSLMIEQVTSLTNNENARIDSHTNSQELASCERMDMEERNEESQEEPRADDDSNSGQHRRDSIEEITIIDENWNTQSNDEESEDSLQPDILGVNIKEEPVSADDEIVEEDDPLNFHSITIKREPTDWALNENELEDVKPNIQQLSEGIQNPIYTPKRQKNGKLLCEPCRNSFLTDTYYERHTTSLRHRVNLKLYLAGKGPTKGKGKALLKVARSKDIMVFRKGDEPGNFYCTECPSVFKHRRNLHTHKKKHLMQIKNIAPVAPEMIEARGTLSDRGDSRSPSISSQDSSMSSKPQRVSAQSARFKFKEELKCEICFKQFASLSGMFSHKRYCGITMYSKRCSYCHQKFTTHSMYAQHRRACRELLGVKHWRDYPKKTETPPPPPRQTPVENPTSNQTNPTVPLDGTVLACTLCSLTFETSGALISHMQENHMDFGKPQSPLPNFAKPNRVSRYNDSTMHYCKYCLKSFPSQGALASHSGYHVRQSMFWCKFCKHAPFTDKLSFRQHMKVHISNPVLNRNVCWICYTRFDSPQTLRDHKINHTNMNVKVFSCNHCDNSYNTKELLSKHRKVAHSFSPTEPVGNQVASDSVSGNLNSTKAQLIDEDNKLFKCRVCKKKFTTIGNLKRHVQNKHPKGSKEVSSAPISKPPENQFQSLFKCTGCFRNFETHIGLMKHRHYCIKFKRTSAFTSTMIKCQDCKKYFASKNTLYKHRLFKRCRPEETKKVVENNHLQFQDCPNCDQQFLSEESLLRHKQHCKPSMDRLTCDCGEVFSSVDLKWSHAESCSLNSTCKLCKLKFNSAEELESHKMICKPEDSKPPPPAVTPRQQAKSAIYHESRFPPIDCPKCNKRFVYHKSFQAHQEKCFNDRWPCSSCPEIFPNEAVLTKHKSSCTYSPHKMNRSSSSSISSLEGPNFKCEFCPMLFMTGNELKLHLTCCEYRIPPQPSPTVHETTFDFNKQYGCNLCGKSFSWKANLQRHQKQAHSGHNSMNSSVGPESAKAPVENAVPTSSSETTIGFYKCKLCPDIVFHKKQGFLEHRMVHEREAARHKETEPQNQNEDSVLLTCELCEKKLPEALYHLHMDEHMNDDFEDLKNESLFADSSTLDDQVPNLNEKFPCDICGKEFNSHTSKKSHRACHYRGNNELSHLKSPPKKKKTFKAKHLRCNICYKLLSINSMPKHKMMHRREQAEFYGENGSSTPVKYATSTPNNATSTTMEVELTITGDQEEAVDDSPTVFPCPRCDRSFKLRKSLMDHLKTHTEDSMETESMSSAPGNIDEYPYKCVYCDLSWKWKSYYERHLSSKKHLEIQKQLANII